MEDWICETCNGPLESLGVLGGREHARCRACGLDHNRAVEPPDDDIIAKVREAREEDEAFANDMKGRG